MAAWVGHTIQSCFCWNLTLRFVQILRFVCVGSQTNLSLLLVSVDLFRIRHVKVCTGRLGLDVPPARPTATCAWQHGGLGLKAWSHKHQFQHNFCQFWSVFQSLEGHETKVPCRPLPNMLMSRLKSCRPASVLLTPSSTAISDLLLVTRQRRLIGFFLRSLLILLLPCKNITHFTNV